MAYTAKRKRSDIAERAAATVDDVPPPKRARSRSQSAARSTADSNAEAQSSGYTTHADSSGEEVLQNVIAEEGLAPDRKVGNKRLQRALEMGPLYSDARQISLNTKVHLASHLFYAETVRRGLIGSEDPRAASVAHSVASWATWPLLPEELPESYHEWALPDEVVALAQRMCAERGYDAILEEVDEIVGPSVALHSQFILDSVLHGLITPFLAGSGRTKARTRRAKPIEESFTWRAILGAAASVDGLPPEVVDRAHARLSLLYRPNDIGGALKLPYLGNSPTDRRIAHQLHPVPRLWPQDMTIYHPKCTEPVPLHTHDGRRPRKGMRAREEQQEDAVIVEENVIPSAT